WINQAPAPGLPSKGIAAALLRPETVHQVHDPDDGAVDELVPVRGCNTAAFGPVLHGPGPALGCVDQQRPPVASPVLAVLVALQPAKDGVGPWLADGEAHCHLFRSSSCFISLATGLPILRSPPSHFWTERRWTPR